jgi:hypothetical protein
LINLVIEVTSGSAMPAGSQRLGHHPRHDVPVLDEGSVYNDGRLLVVRLDEEWNRCMGSFLDVDWDTLFLPETPLLEIFCPAQGSTLALYALLRVVVKRQRGGVGVTDLLVIVLIAVAA